MSKVFNGSYVTSVLLLGRQRRVVRAMPRPLTGYTNNNSIPVDVVMQGLPAPHDKPVFEATQCGIGLLAER